MTAPAAGDVPRKHSQWLTGKPFNVDEDTVEGFAMVKKKFRCNLCGHTFGVGDPARWVYCNSTPGQSTGNFFVCAACDGPDVMERGQRAFKLAQLWFEKYE